jgi:hypothetical protein
MATTRTHDPEAYRTTADIARELDVHPSATTRWINPGVRLKNGGKLLLRAVRTPGGWRIKQAWLDEFLERLTTDRTGPGAPPPPGLAERAEQATAELARAGF